MKTPSRRFSTIAAIVACVKMPPGRPLLGRRGLPGPLHQELPELGRLPPVADVKVSSPTGNRCHRSPITRHRSPITVNRAKGRAFSWSLVTLCGMGAALLCWVICDPQAWAADTSASGAFSERVSERKEMVETQLRGFGRTTISDKSVLDAMLRVPRHRFVPDTYQAFAYGDSPVPIGYGQTISQPYIVALMTQALEMKPGMKVLEIGTGSGYQAAILAEITPSVFTIEIIRPLCESAQQRLQRLGYSSVLVYCADGYHGWSEHAPFDRIIVTCAALHIPPPLFEQLKPGGKMVIPVGGQFETQRLLLVSKDEKGQRTSQNLTLVRFVPLLRGDLREN